MALLGNREKLHQHIPPMPKSVLPIAVHIRNNAKLERVYSLFAYSCDRAEWLRS